MSDSARARKIKIEVEYECPHCKTVVTADTMVKADGYYCEDYVAVDLSCPTCGKWVEVKL